MKPISHKDLFSKAQKGQASFEALLPKDREEIELDDRDPMERVADELAKFSEAVTRLSQTQAQEVTAVLGLILNVLKTIAQPKQEKPIKIDLSDTRPTAWDVQVTQRDLRGKIQQIKIKGE